MRSKFLPVTTTLMLILLTSFSSMWAQAVCTHNWPEDGINFVGIVDGHEIQGYFNTGHPSSSVNGVSGLFFFPQEWTPQQETTDKIFALYGEIDDNCEVQLKDVNGGVWHLRFSAKHTLTGSFAAAKGKSTDVTFELVKDPGCAGQGPWETFRSPDWPITFKYPKRWKVQWHVFYGHGLLAIMCPDARSLAEGKDFLDITKGEGLEPVKSFEGQSGIQVGSFYKYDGKWFVGDCSDTKALSCGPARSSKWRGMTVLQGSYMARHYRAGGGGYLGMGGGISYAFIVADQWVKIDSDQGPLTWDQEGKSGPVIFKGDGVVARLVRSVIPVK